MTLRNIDIVDFKNIASATLEFSPGVNCLLGMNGMGKSNLLEAIHILSMAKPMSAIPDNALVRHGSEMFLVKGNSSQRRIQATQSPAATPRERGKA